MVLGTVVVLGGWVVVVGEAVAGAVVGRAVVGVGCRPVVTVVAGWPEEGTGAIGWRTVVEGAGVPVALGVPVAADVVGAVDEPAGAVVLSWPGLTGRLDAGAAGVFFVVAGEVPHAAASIISATTAAAGAKLARVER